ncbi:hypothetical protein LEP1GSC049_1390 [Leptospira kirschneri serovar Cynopteri str. 3522 CT]|nr:hypothetical protein LEP1GSC018_4115 [Leptospira kirschneri str. 2008720114]EMO79494.1 hypothetical protein LEP1GSC126_1337 [Leptospira kirschneri str. 200801774]EPG49124.1 hypothetical protein LEP1GSC049_1390 [Leptospira kirschneri serovar Cynopteri str. 3522 CT]
MYEFPHFQNLTAKPGFVIVPTIEMLKVKVKKIIVNGY